MEIISFIIVFAFMFMVISLFLGLLASPYFWLIVLALFIYGTYRRYRFRKRMEELHRQQQQREYGAQREQYYQNYNGTSPNDSRSASGSSDDVIDVDYEVVDEKTND